MYFSSQALWGKKACCAQVGSFGEEWTRGSGWWLLHRLASPSALNAPAAKATWPLQEIVLHLLLHLLYSGCSLVRMRNKANSAREPSYLGLLSLRHQVIWGKAPPYHQSPLPPALTHTRLSAASEPPLRPQEPPLPLTSSCSLKTPCASRESWSRGRLAQGPKKPACHLLASLLLAITLVMSINLSLKFLSAL